jgi:hypothetical protein
MTPVLEIVVLMSVVVLKGKTKEGILTEGEGGGKYN